MAATIADKAGVHPAHAVNAAMHAAAEPHDLTQALERALPHVNRRVLHETARHLHPHVVRMHHHARHPREHAEWMAARAAEGFPAPEHDAPEHEWSEWHGKREAAGLSPAPHPPEPPPPTTPVHLRNRFEWRPKSGREITYDRYPTVQQVMGVGSGGPATGGNPGQPGLGEAFSDAVQSVAATVPDMPLENAVNMTAYAATEPCNLVRAFERAMPAIKRALARQCAMQSGPHINRMIEETGIPLPPDAVLPPPATSIVPGSLPPPPPPVPVVEFVPSPPPPSWSRSEAEWHDQERRDWDRMHGAHPVIAAAKQAAEAAAAPHPDASKPAVQAAVRAVADKAAQAAVAAPPGTDVHAAATQAAKTVAATDHPAVAEHPAVKAAVQAAATAATSAAAGSPDAGPVTAAATQAAHAAAAPHADANKPAVAAAVQAAADGAAQAAASAPPGTPPQVVHQAAKEGAQAAAAAHGAAADHPAVKAAVAAAAPAAANAAAPANAGMAGVGNPPRHLQIGPTKLPKPEGPQSLEKECGCLSDSPFLAFLGDEEEQDQLFLPN